MAGTRGGEEDGRRESIKEIHVKYYDSPLPLPLLPPPPPKGGRRLVWLREHRRFILYVSKGDRPIMGKESNGDVCLGRGDSLISLSRSWR